MHQMLLTPDQESTIKNFFKLVMAESGYYYFSPFVIKDCGDNIYEFYKFDDLPNDAKDQILIHKGVKTPA